MAMQKELIKNAFAKMATVPYPFEKVAPPEGLRGKHEYEQEKCIGCGLCARVCPSFAITLEGGVGPQMNGLTVDLGMCLFCGQCEEVCPTHCLRLTSEYELAVTSKDAAILRFPREPPAPKVPKKKEE